MQRMNIKVASEFVLMASELLYYKSKALLPGEEIEDEYFTPPLPADLIQKLLEFKKFQLTSRKLKESYEIQSNLFTRKNEYPDIGEDEEVIIEATLFDIIDAFARLLDSNEVVYQREIEFNEVLVSDRIDYINLLLMKKNQILFNEIFSSNPGVGEIIASFLAILEMTKGKLIVLMQYKVFGEIIILRR
jgi:segregation and condensation protein A